MCYGWFLDSEFASEKVWLNQALFIVFVEEDVELEPTIPTGPPPALTHSAQCLFSCSPKHLYSGEMRMGVTFFSVEHQNCYHKMSENV